MRYIEGNYYEWVLSHIAKNVEGGDLAKNPDRVKLREWAAGVLYSWATTYDDQDEEEADGRQYIEELAKKLEDMKDLDAEEWDSVLFHLWQELAE